MEDKKLFLLKKEENSYLLDEDGVVLYEKSNKLRPRKSDVFIKKSFGGRNIRLGTVKGCAVYSNLVWWLYEGGELK